MYKATSISNCSIPLSKTKSKYYFPKDIAITDIDYIGALISDSGQSIIGRIENAGVKRKVITDEIAKYCFITLVDRAKRKIVSDVPLSYFNVLNVRDNKLSCCIDWQLSYISITNIHDIADIAQYELFFYFIKGISDNIDKAVHYKIKTIKVEPNFNGNLGRLINERDCIYIKQIGINTVKENNVWLDMVDSKGRFFADLHKNIFLRIENNSFLPKLIYQWYFDNIVIDLDNTTLSNGNSTTYLTFYF